MEASACKVKDAFQMQKVAGQYILLYVTLSQAIRI